LPEFSIDMGISGSTIQQKKMEVTSRETGGEGLGWFINQGIE
jgi:hypothetical protein